MSNTVENLKKHYEWQCGVLATSLLVEDFQPHIEVIKQDRGRGHLSHFFPQFKWINQGELMAGSFLSHQINRTIDHKDIDIYFKSKADAEQFIKLNCINMYPAAGDIALKGTKSTDIVNLIYNVPYTDASSLITRFDIRACSIAFDPSSRECFFVNEAILDCMQKKIVFNPLPFNTTVNRLVKYIQKGFSIDAYQRLYFSELIRSEKYNKDLELTTGYGV